MVRERGIDGSSWRIHKRELCWVLVGSWSLSQSQDSVKGEMLLEISENNESGYCELNHFLEGNYGLSVHT